METLTDPPPAWRPTFGEVVADWLAPYTGRTRVAYTSHVRRWVRWCVTNGLDPWEARRAHIETWARLLREREGLAPKSIAVMLSAVCGVYTYAYEEGHLDRDPAANVRRPQLAYLSTSTWLDRDELVRLLAAAEAHPDPNAGALCCILGLNGTRIGETLALDIEDLGQTGTTRTIHLRARKRSSQLTVGISWRTAAAIDRAVGGRLTGPLLRGPDHDRLAYVDAFDLVRQVATTAGIGRPITPHSLRHTFVTLSREVGVADRDIMASTGHQSPAMIDYYDRARLAVVHNATHALTEWLDT